jgi:hypothetical protein
VFTGPASTCSVRIDRSAPVALGRGRTAGRTLHAPGHERHGMRACWRSDEPCECGIVVAQCSVGVKALPSTRTDQSGNIALNRAAMRAKV